jgi:hypothetical protein
LRVGADFGGGKGWVGFELENLLGKEYLGKWLGFCLGKEEMEGRKTAREIDPRELFEERRLSRLLLIRWSRVGDGRGGVVTRGLFEWRVESLVVLNRFAEMIDLWAGWI